MGPKFRLGYTAAVLSFLPFALKRAADSFDEGFYLFYHKNAAFGAVTGLSLALMTLLPFNTQYLPLAFGAAVIGAGQGIAYTAFLRSTLQRQMATRAPVYEEFRL